MDEQGPTADATAAAAGGSVHERATVQGRHRRHRSPARQRALKVLYGEDEWLVVTQAAEFAGLRASSYVATSALAAAEQVVHHETLAEQRTDRRGRATSATPTADRELLAELIQARLALRRFAVNVNQAAAVLNAIGRAPDGSSRPWLERHGPWSASTPLRAGLVAMRFR